MKPLLDLVLEREGTSAADLEAEVAENMELGLRFVSPRFNASAVYFDNEFNNRLEFFGPQIRQHSKLHDRFGRALRQRGRYRLERF